MVEGVEVPSRRLVGRPSRTPRAAVRLDPSAAGKKLVTLSAAPLLAETIRRLHDERSLTDLLVF